MFVRGVCAYVEKIDKNKIIVLYSYEMTKVCLRSMLKRKENEKIYSGVLKSTTPKIGPEI